MSQPNVQQFADLLSDALHQIKKRETKSIRVIQDEIGYALGRTGGSVIESWRKGAHMPQKIRDVEELAAILVTRGRLSVAWFDRYVQANGYDTELAGLRRRLFPQESAGPNYAPPAPFQAPALMTPMVGRRQVMAAICTQLQQVEGPRIVALVGMGGMGKTTLASYVAHALRAVFSGGVLWGFMATNDASDIVEQWARGYGYDLSSVHDLQSRAAALRGLLATRQALLVLDDVTYARDIRILLPGGNSCAVLLTTRNEEVAIALSAQIFRLDELSMGESLELLATLVGNERIFAEQDAARRICSQMQFLPLALEIVGQLLKARPNRRLADMAGHLEVLDHRLNLRISDRAVRTSFSASWATLDEAQRAAFACLAVFGGRAFGPEALAYVAELDLYTAQDQLYTLKTLSLISESSADRFQQHALLAGFAREQLGPSPAPYVRMVEYYGQFVREHCDQDAQLEQEWENITAAMQIASDLHEWPLVLAFGKLLMAYWFRQARFAQARQGCQLMYTAAVGVHALPEQAFAQLKWGWACLEQDDYGETAQHLEASQRIFERLADDAGCADAHYGLARMAMERADYAGAHRHLAQCLPVYEHLPDLVGMARTYYLQAYLAYHVGDLELTRTLYERAHDIQSGQKVNPDILPTIRLIVDVAIEEQEYATAEQYCRQALDIAQQIQNRGEIAATYYSMAVVARMQRRLALALDYIQRAEELFEKMGDRGYLALVLYEQSRIQFLLGELYRAQSAAEQSTTLFRALEDSFNLVYALNHLGRIQLESGHAVTAQTIWQEAMAIAEPLAHPLLGELRRRLGDMVEIPT